MVKSRGQGQITTGVYAAEVEGVELDDAESDDTEFDDAEHPTPTAIQNKSAVGA